VSRTPLRGFVGEVEVSTRSDDAVLRVATFNARHGAGPLGIVSNRKLVDTCRSLDADILALQEVDRHVVRSWFRDQPAYVARRLAQRVVAAPAKRTPVGGRQCNALCARGRIDDVEVVELPRREGDERRVALLASVRLVGGTVSVACVHLEHARSNGAEQLEHTLATLATRPGPRLVAGDFNLRPDVVLPRLAAHGYVAAESGPTASAVDPKRRIDWIAVDEGLRIVGSRLHQPFVGDHLPLSADLAWRS
jgi:endonuclease/exonuclease/phosphatase family metal-dependent hydrolase